MATLNDYLQQAQRFLREKKQDLINPQDLIVYINRARREIAMRTQCLRVLTQSSAPCVTASVIAAGSGYSNSPTVTITSPDFPSGAVVNPNGAQATASATVQSGTIAAVNILYGGDGYFQPLATVTDATGTGASVTVQTGPINVLNQAQEVYPFSGIYLGNNPGIKSVFAVQSVSIIYANFRYSLPMYSFSVYQAMIRQYPYQYEYVPTFCSQYGQGAAGSLYFYPLPSQQYQWEGDCYCLPQDLTTNLSVETIPDPWTDAVSYFSAHLAFLEIQNFNAAKFYLDLYNNELGIYSRSARIGRTINPYGRYLIPFILGGLESLLATAHYIGSMLS